MQKISQSWDIERVPNHWLTDLFHQTERDGAFSWSGIWQFWENSKSPAVVLIDNDNYVAGDSDWDGLWFSAGSGGKQLKAEIISKTIKHQIAVRRSQSNRQIGGKRGNLTPNEMSTEIASHFSKYWKYWNQRVECKLVEKCCDNKKKCISQLQLEWYGIILDHKEEVLRFNWWYHDQVDRKKSWKLPRVIRAKGKKIVKM